MAPPPEEEANAAVLALFERDAADGTPLTTTEVATGVGCSRRTAYNRLRRLAAADRLATKKVGAKGRVWWLPTGAEGRAPDGPAFADRFGLPLTELVLQLFASSPVGIAIVDADGTIAFANDSLGDLLGRAEDSLQDLPAHSLFEDVRDDDGRSLSQTRSPITRAAATATPVVDARYERDGVAGAVERVAVDAVPITTEDGSVEGVGLAVTDVSVDHAREADLEGQRTELMRLNRVNSVVRGVSHAVTSARTREALERDICRLVADSDLYLFAVLGEFSASYTAFTVRSAVGVGAEEIEAIIESPDAPLVDDGPAATAAKTGEVQAVQNITDLPAAYWEAAAEALQFRSYASIPLVHRDVVYGVLGVYARQPAAFDADERALLAELGEMVGHGLHALEAAERLQSDQHVELTFRSEHLGERFQELGYDVELTVEGTVNREDGTPLQYWTVSGVEAGAFVRAVRDRPTVLDVDLLKRSGDSLLVEVHTSSESLSAAFGALDGRITGATLTEEALYVVAQFPAAADVDGVVEAGHALYPDLSLEERRLVYTPRLLSELAEEHLTGRQWTTVQRAYYAGYFEQPRRRTGTELAEKMDVTTTTFHRHLRNAEAEFFRVLFETSPDPGKVP
ncbi:MULTISPECIES: bacterio-opsin activator domain-containing protein [Haloarcula]|uniref:bacterio-opsin activator domain-containing protein n=1 Tax=Haloarcula TaxID=2237 RepID=UPI0023EC26C1|nr:bacterio-opsin activator domain-containing protein [Halomicroarcula sp. XH51]